MWTMLGSNSQRLACLCLPSTKIKHVHNHTQLYLGFFSCMSFLRISENVFYSVTLSHTSQILHSVPTYQTLCPLFVHIPSPICAVLVFHWNMVNLPEASLLKKTPSPSSSTYHSSSGREETLWPPPISMMGFSLA